MTESSRTRLAAIVEQAPGVTPPNARFRRMSFTGESLESTAIYLATNDIRDDLMTSEPVLSGQENKGSIDYQLRYPKNLSTDSNLLMAVLRNPWILTPERDNDLTPGSAITSVAVGGFTCAPGAAFAPGHLIFASGFAQGPNNGLFVAGVGTNATNISTIGTVAEAAPPGAARLKMVGFTSTPGDIQATATGLASTTVDFTGFGLGLGRWLKLWGFTGNLGNNDWVRIIAISPHSLTLDHLPQAWGADPAAAVAVSVCIGDQVRNGVTPLSLSIERTFLGQAVPTAILQRGMRPDSLQIKISEKALVTCQYSFWGLSSYEGPNQAGLSYDLPPFYRVIAAHANVGRVSEAGAAFRGPNYCRSLEINIKNNLREVRDVQIPTSVQLTDGQGDITGTMAVHFGDDTLRQKFLNGVPTQLSTRFNKDGAALIVGLPRVTLDKDGKVNASKRDEDIVASYGYTASVDPLTNAQILVDRFEYYA